jgi:hypothetical protein
MLDAIPAEVRRTGFQGRKDDVVEFDPNGRANRVEVNFVVGVNEFLEGAQKSVKV